MFVLDEGDRMLDMGFINDIRTILSLAPKKKQGLLFSATFSHEIKRLADGLLQSPVVIDVPRQKMEPISQLIHPVDSARKKELLSFLIKSKNLRQALIFTRTKRGAERLAEDLQAEGISATAIHGNKSQAARSRALADFKRGIVRALVATDVAARGLDINQLPHVFNFELPETSEDYVHRIGRTGRAGNLGEAISLVCVDEHNLLRNIERLLKTELPKETIAGFEPNPSIRPQPIRRGGGRFARGGGGGGGGRFQSRNFKSRKSLRS
jgi:ATP-dependent RNA helicase RhlE